MNLPIATNTQSLHKYNIYVWDEPLDSVSIIGYNDNNNGRYAFSSAIFRNRPIVDRTVIAGAVDSV